MNNNSPAKKSVTTDPGKGWHAHKKVAGEAARRLLAAPVSTGLTIVVIATALLLPALVLGLNSNIDRVLDRFQQQVELNAYLDLDVDEIRAREVSEDLLSWQDINSVVFIPADQALLDMAEGLGFADMVAELERNPLPATLVIEPQSRDPQVLQDLATRLQELPAIATVQLDSQWLQRLAAISRLLQRAGLILAAIMVLGLLLIVGNTIKLEVENRREQIRVYKLIGATDGFVARPFMYTGLYFGLGGGLLAALIQVVLLSLLNPQIEALGVLYASDFELRGLGPLGLLLLVLAGGLSGWLGATAASIRQILAIEP